MQEWKKKIVQWKLISHFELQYETNDEEIIEVEDHEDNDELDDLLKNLIVGLQAVMEQPSIIKLLSKEENKKWSSFSWPINSSRNV